MYYLDQFEMKFSAHKFSEKCHSDLVTLTSSIMMFSFLAFCLPTMTPTASETGELNIRT